MSSQNAQRIADAIHGELIDEAPKSSRNMKEEEIKKHYKSWTEIAMCIVTETKKQFNKVSRFQQRSIAYDAFELLFKRIHGKNCSVDSFYITVAFLKSKLAAEKRKFAELKN